MSSIQSINGSTVVFPTPVTTSPTAGAPSASAAAALPPPSAQLAPVSDLGAQLAVLMVKTGQAARQQDQKERAADEKAEDDAERAQVASLHQQASETRKEGLTEGFATIGEGLCTAGSAVVDKDTAPGGHSPWSVGATKGLGLGFKGAGVIGSAEYKANGQDDATDAQAHANDASHAKRAADDQSDDIKNDRDLISAAVDFYKQYSDTKAQERAAVAHGA